MWSFHLFLSDDEKQRVMVTTDGLSASQVIIPRPTCEDGVCRGAEGSDTERLKWRLNRASSSWPGARSASPP